MDYDSDSSDFHFPSDTGLAKLSSPLSFKVPESRDWALDEFMQTLSSKPCMETDNLTSFKQYIPVTEEKQDFSFGPPKLNIPTYEEKDFLAQISQHFLDLERKELHDILKGGFSLVQNDIQSNVQPQVSPFASAHPGITWFDEAYDYGHQESNIQTIENVSFSRKSSPFDQHPPMNNVSTLSDIVDEEDHLEEYIHVAPLPQIQKPLPALPPTPKKKKKGLKYIKQKISQSFSSNDKKPLFLQNTRKFISKLFH